MTQEHSPVYAQFLKQHGVYLVNAKPDAYRVPDASGIGCISFSMHSELSTWLETHACTGEHPVCIATGIKLMTSAAGGRRRRKRRRNPVAPSNRGITKQQLHTVICCPVVTAFTLVRDLLYCVPWCRLYELSAKEKKRKEKTTPFGINLMRSQGLYRAAQR